MAKRKTRAPLIILFLALVIAAIIYGGHWLLRESHKQMLHETEQSLKSSATLQVSLMTVWYGAIYNQVKAFVDVDMLRLFASEVDSANISTEKLLQFSHPEDTDEPMAKDPALDNFTTRLPGLDQLLSEFVKKNSFIYGSVLARDLKPYLVTSDPLKLDEEDLNLLKPVVENAAIVILPIRKQNHELLVEMAFPIMAPAYIDKLGKRVVGVFLGTCSVQKVISAIDHIDNTGFFTSAILEKSKAGLQLIDPLYPGGRRELLESWELQNNELALAIRPEPTRAGKDMAAYSLAMPLQDLPWYVMQAMKVENAEAAFRRFKKNVYVGCGLLISLAVILVAALWWWVVGRRERAIATQMRKLYLIANEQKQILDGVNTALSAGVVLNDLEGVIYYVNQKYAEMAHMAPEQMYGMKYQHLPYEMARSLVQHTLAINEKPELTNFTEILPVGEESRHYLTACSPFTDEQNCLVGMVSVYSDITELVEAQNRAQHMVTQTVAVFVRAIEAVDPYLCGQSSSMAQLGVTLAKILHKNDPATLDTLRTAASLSQIGMIQLPSSLLLKTGALTKEERLQMQQHVEYARAALQGVDFGLPVLEAITQMYERIDGSGYPKHLQENAICFNAKILGVANTFCALMRPRSYRTAHTIESALNILEMKPLKYDWNIVQALRKYLATEDGQVFIKNLVEHKVEAKFGSDIA
ncbi:MAG: PAS domain-containing protein [Desulfovibrionaceae bacterium]|nr:PAS domain-containing protein [Desulfovibrionaceae bacterium]